MKKILSVGLLAFALAAVGFSDGGHGNSLDPREVPRYVIDIEAAGAEETVKFKAAYVFGDGKMETVLGQTPHRIQGKDKWLSAIIQRVSGRPDLRVTLRKIEGEEKARLVSGTSKTFSLSSEIEKRPGGQQYISHSIQTFGPQ